jgi:hypothetical protein
MRGRAILLAWVMAAQVAAPSFALASTVRTCCCSGGHGGKMCHCPSCTKGRAIEEGQDFVRSCGSEATLATPSPALAVVAPISRVAVAAPSAAVRTVSTQPNAPPWRPVEVPTPPPLS